MSMMVIQEITVEENIAQERFACDLDKCKGACCVLPGYRGAPLLDDECDELERVAETAAKYLSEKHRRVLTTFGAYEGTPGNYATTCVEDNDCVFVYYDEGVARCAVEKAYIQKETNWRKPISCHLFPIRVSSLGIEKLRYEKISECKPGRMRGEQENVPLYEFLREPLVRQYGQVWYDEFLKECQMRDSNTLSMKSVKR